MKFPPEDLRIYFNAIVETGVYGSSQQEVTDFALRKFIADELRDGVLRGMIEWHRDEADQVATELYRYGLIDS